jgi:hypothetical protein
MVPWKLIFKHTLQWIGIDFFIQINLSEYTLCFVGLSEKHCTDLLIFKHIVQWYYANLPDKH